MVGGEGEVAFPLFREDRFTSPRGTRENAVDKGNPERGPLETVPWEARLSPSGMTRKRRLESHSEGSQIGRDPGLLGNYALNILIPS